MGQDANLMDELAALRNRVGELEGALGQRTQAEMRYRELMDHLNVGLFISTMDGTVVDASVRAAEMAGCASVAELTSRSGLQNFEDPSDRQRLLQALERSGSVRNLELRFVRKDGTPYWVSLSAVLERHASGQPDSIFGVVEDISERRRGAQELLSSQRLFNSLVETSQDLVWRVDTEGRFTYLNPAWSSIMGIPVNEMLGQRFFDFQSPETAERDTKVFRRLLQERGIERGHCTTLVRKDGISVILNVNASVYYDDQGQVQGTQGTAQDVTEQRRMARALLDRESLLREAQRVAQLGHYVLDVASGHWSNSEALDSIFGIDAGYVRDVDGWLALIHRDDRDAMKVYLSEHVLACRLPFDREYRIVQVNTGEERWVHGLGKLEFGDHGEPLRMFGTIQDITARKQVEEALQSAQDFAQNLIETANVIVIGLDMDGNVTIFNRAAEQIMGYAQAEVLGKSWFEFVAPDSRHPGIRRDYERLRSREKLHSFENPILTRGGEIRNIVWQGNAVVRRGVVVGTVSFGMDITERMQAEEGRARLEERLRQSQRLEALGLLVGGVAHDLNNLLTPIVGYGDLLLEEPLSEEVRGILADIREAGGRAQNLVRQLLAFGRKQTLNMHPLDLHSAVRELVRTLRRSLRDNIKIDLVLREPSCAVMADAIQLEQVVTNLARNAQDAMPNGGTLTVEVADCVVEAGLLATGGPPPGHYARLSVKDTGVGIPRELLNHIFEPFFTNKVPGQGTGLGLAVVHGIVKQHGGEIVVSSTAGAGARFDVYWPSTTMPRPIVATPPPSESRGPRGGETVLLAEDDPAVRSATCAMLTHLGYRVLCPVQPEDCVRIAEADQKRIQLLVTDVMMPNLSGMELRRRVSQVAPHIRVLFMSGFPGTEMAERGELKKDMEFIQKPFTLDGLAKKVREVLDAPEAHPPNIAID